MPIVYVHGVANRLDQAGHLPGWDDIAEYLRHYVAPEISSSPDKVPIKLAYWGEFGADFYWNGISRPRTKLLGQGPSRIDIHDQLAELGGLDQLPEGPSVSLGPRGLSSGQVRSTGTENKKRLRDLTPLQLSDLLCSAIDKIKRVTDARARVLADDVANDEEFRQRLSSAPDYIEEINLLNDELVSRGCGTESLAAQGSNDFWRAVVDRASEVVTRLNSTPAYALSRLAIEARGPINQAVTTLFGDVFRYMEQRNDTPGTIRGVVLKAFRDAKQEAISHTEPLIVVSHSMGGQIVFDLATNFLEGAGIRIDFWVSAASQVGLFEELKLLLSSDPRIRGPLGRAKFPANIAYWWNVWDANDILSYTGHSIFDLQLDDEEWNSGASVADAHGAYLRRPSFYRKLAAKISASRQQNLDQP